MAQIDYYFEKFFDKNQKFIRVIPQQYAEVLRQKFAENPYLWYDAVSPRSKAEELICLTDNDYSKVWDEHCDCCYKTINRKYTDVCYISEDNMTWLCESCYKKLSSKARG